MWLAGTVVLWFISLGFVLVGSGVITGRSVDLLRCRLRWLGSKLWAMATKDWDRFRSAGPYPREVGVAILRDDPFAPVLADPEGPFEVPLWFLETIWAAGEGGNPWETTALTDVDFNREFYLVVYGCGAWDVFPNPFPEPEVSPGDGGGCAPLPPYVT